MKFETHIRPQMPHKSRHRAWHLPQVKKGINLDKSVDIGNIYRPPKDLVEKYTEFTRELVPILNTFATNNNEVIIAGDFNTDLLKLNDRLVFSEYFDMLTSHSFYPDFILPI